MAEQTVMVPAYSPMAMLRQAAVLLGVAAAVAIGVWVALWAKDPAWTVLYGDLAERDITAVVDALERYDVPYRIDYDSGAVLVARDRADEMRVKLAAEGVPRGKGVGFELMEEEQGFGSSQFAEQVRYQRALEGELARSIARLRPVRAARVHLALPRQSAFVRDRRRPSASVVVELYPGHRLDGEEVEAVTELVAASVPDLDVDHVAVVDQRGRLLSGRGGDERMRLSAQQFELVHQLEQTYARRVEEIVAPLVGHDGVKAQVTVDMDFTATEQASETYNPDLAVTRSERTVEEERSGPGAAAGVPGALTNEPPAGGTAVPQTAAAGDAAGAPPAAAKTVRRQATRNYEVDRTIVHTRSGAARVRRITVAAVVDYKQVPGEDGKPVAQPLSDEEMARLTALIKEAVGFDASRGDTVNLVNAPFVAPPPAEPLPEPPLWKQPWVWTLGKQLAGAALVLFLVLGVLRPTLRNLMTRPGPVAGAAQVPAGELPAGAAAQALPGSGAPALPAGQAPAGAAADASGTPALGAPAMTPDPDSVRSYVAQDPRVAAQVVRSWIGDQS